MFFFFFFVSPTLQRYEAETYIPRSDGEAKRAAKEVFNTVPS